jgi:hypothetical protein
MAALAESLRTMPPSWTDQCERLRNYGHGPSSIEPPLFVVSKTVEVATIRKLTSFPYQHCTTNMTEHCSILQSAALLCF